MGRRSTHPWGAAIVLVTVAACGAGQSPTGRADAGGGPPTPRSDVPGLALWLDGATGVTTNGGAVTRWRDRSRHQHTFVPQGAEFGAIAVGAIGVHPALSFSGKHRMFSEATDAAARAAMTIGDGDFLLAVVVRAARGPAPQQIAMAFMPVVSPERLDPLDSALFVNFDEALEVGFGAGEPSNRFAITAGGPFHDRRPRVVVVLATGDAVEIRVDGQLALADPNGRRHGRLADGRRVTLPYAPAFLGNWDFDFQGLIGELGEVVLVTGPDSGAARVAIESHLVAKYLR